MEEGKKLFFRYGGNHGLMNHDGVLDDYRQIGVTSRQEMEWASELVDDLLIKFVQEKVVDENFHRLVTLIKTFNLALTLESLSELVRSQLGKLDTFTQLLACEQIYEVAQHFRREGLLKDGGQRVMGDLRAIAIQLSTSPYTIAEFYRRGLLLPGALSDESLRSRIRLIQDDLQKCAR